MINKILINLKSIFCVALPVICLGVYADKQQTSYAPYYDAPKEAYVKSMKTVFADIYSRNWLKAEKDYEKLVEKSNLAQTKNPTFTNTQLEALYPLPDVALAILYSTDFSTLEASQRPSIVRNYNKAYYYLKAALTYNKKSKLNSFLSDPSVNVNLNLLEDRIEDALCTNATKLDTEEAYDDVIDSLLPQSLRLQSMKMQREMLAYNTIINSPTESECIRFMNKYTDGRVAYRSAISHALDSIQFHSMKVSVASLVKYISEHPQSSLIKVAKDSLESLEYQAIKQTAASCRKYLEKYPTSTHTIEVKNRYAELSYKETLAAGTPEAYFAYCKEFPYDLHYQNILDTLLYRAVTDIYDTLFAEKNPNLKNVLSSALYDSQVKRDSAEMKMVEKSLVPPKRRNLWTGVTLDTVIKPFDHINIEDIDIKSKKMATVKVILSGPSSDPEKPVQTGVLLDFIFEDNALKINKIDYTAITK